MDQITRQNHTNNHTKNYIKGILFGCVVCLFTMLLFALFLTLKDVGEGMVTVLTLVALALGACIGGYATAYGIGRSGISIGCQIGSILFAITFISGTVCFGLEFSTMLPMKAIACIASGCVGGVIGVNKTAKRKFK